MAKDGLIYNGSRKYKGRPLILISEPEFPYLEALAPYQPLAMKVSV